jgi:hypothetical protein
MNLFSDIPEFVIPTNLLKHDNLYSIGLRAFDYNASGHLQRRSNYFFPYAPVAHALKDAAIDYYTVREIWKIPASVKSTVTGVVVAPVCPACGILLTGIQAYNLAIEPVIEDFIINKVKLAIDPFDHDYGIAVKPSFNTAPTIIPDGIFTSEMSDLGNSILQSYSDIYSYIEALSITADRYLSALEVGDLGAANLQSGSLYDLILSTAAAYATTGTELKALKALMLESQIQFDVIDINELIAVMQGIGADGFPTFELDVFESLGISQNTIDDILEDFLSWDITALAPFDLYSAFDANIALIESSLRLFTLTAVPEPHSIYLLAVALFGAAVIRRPLVKKVKRHDSRHV